MTTIDYQFIGASGFLCPDCGVAIAIVQSATDGRRHFVCPECLWEYAADVEHVDLKSLPKGPNVPAPFPYWGGKAKASPLIWALLGEVQTIVDPCGGSATALIRNPYGQRPRTIYNDVDCLLANAQRCLQEDPDETAYWADNPTSHVDLIARREWLRQKRAAVREAMILDPTWRSPQIAGWWLWATSCSIDMMRHAPVTDEQAYAYAEAVANLPSASELLGLKIDGRCPCRCTDSGHKGVAAQRGMPHVEKTDGGQGVMPQRHNAGDFDVSGQPETKFDRSCPCRCTGSYGKGVAAQGRSGQIPHVKNSDGGSGVMALRHNPGGMSDLGDHMADAQPSVEARSAGGQGVQQQRIGVSQQMPQVLARGKGGSGCSQQRSGIADVHGRNETSPAITNWSSGQGVNQQKGGPNCTIPMVNQTNSGRGISQQRDTTCSKHGAVIPISEIGQRPQVHIKDGGEGCTQQRKGETDAKHGALSNRMQCRVYISPGGEGCMTQREYSGGSSQRLIIDPAGDANPYSGQRLLPWFRELSTLMRRWYVLCQPWQKVVNSKCVLGQTPSSPKKITGILLDPPYDFTKRGELYSEDQAGVAAEMVEWLLTPLDWKGDVGVCAPWHHPRLRIVMCGYDDDASIMRLAAEGPGRVYGWKRGGGMEATGNKGKVRRQEVIVASPACLEPEGAAA